jgi:hypothetical protein
MLLSIVAAIALQSTASDLRLEGTRTMVTAALRGLETREVGDETTQSWFDRQPTAKENNVVTATRLAVRKMEAWKICASGAVGRWATSNEPAVVVIDGAIGACSEHTEQYLSALLSIKADERVVYNIDAGEDMVRHLQDTWRPRLTAIVLERRSSKR